MAEDITTPSNNLVKIIWKEPYVSEGLNKKLNGLIPAGVIRGGKLVANIVNSTVTIQIDPDSGDSVYSFIDTNGHQLTFRQDKDVDLDLDVGSLPGNTIYIGLEIIYSVSAQTSVKWRGYSQAEVDADSSIVVLGSVVVPAVAAPIPASDISDDRRRLAWGDISRYMREAQQVIKNGSFEIADDSVPSAGDVAWPHWDYPQATETSVSWQVISTGTPLVGDKHLQLTLTGAGTQVGILPHEGFYQVRGGGTVKAKIGVSGNSLTPGPGSGGHMGLRIIVTDEDPSNVIQNIYAEDVSLSGTFAYTESEITFRLDDSAKWIRAEVYYDDDGNSSTGTIYFDDVRLWIEQPQIDEGQVESFGPLHDGAVIGRSLDVAPPPGIATSLNDFISNILSVRFDNSDEYNVARRPDGALSFLLRLINGSLEVPFSSSGYTLLFEGENASGGNIRAYLTSNDIYSNDALVFTVNARWTGTQWARDTALDSRYTAIGHQDFYDCIYQSTDSSPWNSSDWTSVGERTFVADETGVKSYLKLFARSGLDIGDDIEGSATDLALPRIFNNVPAVTTGRYVCLWEMPTNDSNGTIRLYMSGFPLPGGSATSGFSIVYNAKWDGSDWTRVGEETTKDSVRYDFTRWGLHIYFRDEAEVDTWTDSAWEADNYAPIEIKPSGNDGDEYGEIDLRDGFIDLTRGLTARSNPDPDDFVMNRLFAKSIVKGLI